MCRFVSQDLLVESVHLDCRHLYDAKEMVQLEVSKLAACFESSLQGLSRSSSTELPIQLVLTCLKQVNAKQKRVRLLSETLEDGFSAGLIRTRRSVQIIREEGLKAAFDTEGARVGDKLIEEALHCSAAE